MIIDYSICIAMELTDHLVSGRVFSWIVKLENSGKNSGKMWALEDRLLRLNHFLLDCL